MIYKLFVPDYVWIEYQQTLTNKLSGKKLNRLKIYSKLIERKVLIGKFISI